MSTPEGVPGIAEIAAMLDKYFIGPISDDVVAKLHDEVARVLADPPSRAGRASSFLPSNGGLGFGRAWREELSYGLTTPRPIDLAAFIAWATKGYPPARPYCPDAFVGTWIQREPSAPSPPRWTFERDGGFAAPDTPFASRIYWCVHRQGDKPSDASVWLEDKLRMGPKRLLVLELGARQLNLQPGAGAIVRLERV
jgi:hypothetical protein